MIKFRKAIRNLSLCTVFTLNTLINPNLIYAENEKETFRIPSSYTSSQVIDSESNENLEKILKDIYSTPNNILNKIHLNSQGVKGINFQLPDLGFLSDLLIYIGYRREIDSQGIKLDTFLNNFFIDNGIFYFLAGSSLIDLENLTNTYLGFGSSDLPINFSVICDYNFKKLEEITPLDQSELYNYDFALTRQGLGELELGFLNSDKIYVGYQQSSSLDRELKDSNFSNMIIIGYGHIKSLENVLKGVNDEFVKTGIKPSNNLSGSGLSLKIINEPNQETMKRVDFSQRFNIGSVYVEPTIVKIISEKAFKSGVLDSYELKLGLSSFTGLEIYGKSNNDGINGRQTYEGGLSLKFDF